MLSGKIDPPPFPFPEHDRRWEVTILTSETRYEKTPGGHERIRYDFREIVLKNISLYCKLLEVHPNIETLTAQAVREIVDNIYEHGYGKAEGKPITLVFFLGLEKPSPDTPRVMEIWFIDQGKEFNEADRMRAKNILSPDAQAAGRGLGLKHSDALVKDYQCQPRGYYQEHQVNVQKIQLLEDPE